MAILLGAVAFVGAVVNGTAGLGFAIVSGAALATLLDPKISVILLSVVTPLLSLQQVWRHRRRAYVWRRLIPVVVGALVGVLVGTQLLVLLPTFALSLAFGAFTLWYASSALKKEPMRLHPRFERFVAPVVGVTAGVSNGSLGASGPVLGSYFMAVGLEPTEFIFAAASMFITMGIVRVLGLIVLNQYTAVTLLTSLGLVIPAVAGQWVGFWLQGRLPKVVFQRVILGVLLVAGVNLMLRGAQGALFVAGYSVALPGVH